MFCVITLLSALVMGLLVKSQHTGTSCSGGTTAYLEIDTRTFDLLAGQTINVGVVTVVLADNDSYAKSFFFAHFLKSNNTHTNKQTKNTQKKKI